MTEPTRRVQAAASGDRAAFEALVRHHQPAVAAIAFGVVREPRASEDVAQETFLQAWRKLPQLRDPASFGPWLRQLARNTGRQYLRTEGRRDQRVTLASGSLQQAVDHDTADQRLLDAETQAVVEEALDALGSDDREILVLFHREGRSTRQVAELLDLADATVRKRLSRARGRLRDGVEARFSEVVRRTAPGAALTAAIAAGLLATPQARAAPTGRLALLASAAGLLALVAWWGFAADTPSPLPPVAEPPSIEAAALVTPATTERARRAARPAPIPPPALPDETVDMTVPIGVPDRVHRSFSVNVGIGAERWFPTFDDVPELPDTEASRTLQALLDLEAEGAWETDSHADLLTTFLEQAVAEGWTDPGLDVDEAGWGALVAMEALRRQAILDEPVEPSVEPDPDLSAMADLAYFVSRSGDSGLRDFAALYELEALDRPGYAPSQADVDRVLALIEHEDSLVAEAAAGHLPPFLRKMGRLLDAAQLDQLLTRVRTFEDGRGRAVLAVLGMEQAVAIGDPQQALDWLDVADGAMEAWCERPSLACDLFTRQRPVLAAQVRLAAKHPPATWQEAVAQRTLVCFGDAGLRPGEDGLLLEGTWSAGWSWTAGPEVPGVVVACLSGPLEPPPTNDVSVQLTAVDGVAPW